LSAQKKKRAVVRKKLRKKGEKGQVSPYEKTLLLVSATGKKMNDTVSRQKAGEKSRAKMRGEEQNGWKEIMTR